MLRREYLSTTGRTVGTTDAALAGHRALRDDAPTPEVRAGFGSAVDEPTRVRASLAAGQEVVEAADP